MKKKMGVSFLQGPHLCNKMSQGKKKTERGKQLVSTQPLLCPGTMYLIKELKSGMITERCNFLTSRQGNVKFPFQEASKSITLMGLEETALQSEC